MASRKSRLLAYYQQLIDKASEGLKRNADGSLVEGALRRSLAGIVRETLDADALANQKAAAIIEALAKQPGEDGEEDDDGGGLLQLELFGETYPYNPRRLIKNAWGDIIEEDKAPLSFILAELSRNAIHAARVMTWNSRKTRKAEYFQRWVESEMALSRSVLELTWGNCARETGILRESSP